MSDKVVPFLLGFVVASCGRILFHIGYLALAGCAFAAGHYLR